MLPEKVIMQGKSRALPHGQLSRDGYGAPRTHHLLEMLWLASKTALQVRSVIINRTDVNSHKQDQLFMPGR